MSKLNYYYFNPFSKQYYFPEGFQNYKVFSSFYQPYTLSGQLLWFLWFHFGWFRTICKESQIEKHFPVKDIFKYIPQKSMLAFNKGTVGPEQKITLLGIEPENNREFFVKYAASDLAQANVQNEGFVLQQLQHLSFVPIVQQLEIETTYTLLKTSVFEGKRFTSLNLDERVVDILNILTSQKINVLKKYEVDVKLAFAHGDFCPWNIMEHEGDLRVFDWEMAGLYPYGYDLFTYIFQTAALVEPNISISSLYEQHQLSIKELFDSWGITDPKPYVVAFAALKLEFETSKKNQKLSAYYQQLYDYAQTL